MSVISSRPALVLIDACTSWASIGAAAYYEAPIYRTVVGALKQYDLPDLAAAALQRRTVSRLLAIGPRSALLQPLSEAEAEAEYKFVRDSGGLMKLAIGEHTPAEAASAVLAFLPN